MNKNKKEGTGLIFWLQPTLNRVGEQVVKKKSVSKERTQSGTGSTQGRLPKKRSNSKVCRRIQRPKGNIYT